MYDSMYITEVQSVDVLCFCRRITCTSSRLTSNNKRKYQHIVTEKAAQGAGKRNKKTIKFQKTSKFQKK